MVYEVVCDPWFQSKPVTRDLFKVGSPRWVLPPGTRHKPIPGGLDANFLLATVPGGNTHPSSLRRACITFERYDTHFQVGVWHSPGGSKPLQFEFWICAVCQTRVENCPGLLSGTQRRQYLAVKNQSFSYWETRIALPHVHLQKATVG